MIGYRQKGNTRPQAPKAAKKKLRREPRRVKRLQTRVLPRPRLRGYKAERKELMLDRVSPKEWKPCDCRDAARLRLSANELGDLKGIRFQRSNEDGLGRIQIAGFRLPSGLQFAIVDRVDAPESDKGANIEVPFDDPLKIGDHLDEVLLALGLESRDVMSLAKEVKFRTHGVYAVSPEHETTLLEEFRCKADAHASYRGVVDTYEHTFPRGTKFKIQPIAKSTRARKVQHPLPRARRGP